MSASFLPYQLFDILGLDKFGFGWFNSAKIKLKLEPELRISILRPSQGCSATA